MAQTTSRTPRTIRMREQRVLLVHPGIYATDNPLLFPPWGALCVATALRKAGCDVQVADLNGESIPESVERLLADTRPTVIGITGKLGLGARRLREVVETVRAFGELIPIGVGGPLVASFPDPRDELWEGVDARFVGDGENSFLRWLVEGCPSEADPIAGEPVDLDCVGVPAWWDGLADYVRPASWWPNMDVPGMHVASARGCTRRCTFCYLRTQYPKHFFRFMSAGRLLDDLDLLHTRFGATGFYTVDDCFIDRSGERVRRFCAELITRGAPYRLGCDVQWPDLENLELLALMYHGGFRCFYLGLEAASSDVRRRLGKGRISSDPAAVLQRVIDMGFLIRASVGIGWPGETADDVEATLQLIDAVPDLIFDGYRYLPLPGLPLTERWAHSTGPDGVERAHELQFQDYSGFNSNFSSISDPEYERLWVELLARQDERQARQFDKRPSHQ